MKNSIIVATIYLLTLLSCNPRTDNSSGVSSKYQETNYGENLEAGRYLHVRGFKFYYETYGEGEPLLLIHGNEGSIHDFHRNIPYFSSTYKVIAADSRSQGKSTDNADSLSYEMMAEDFRVLLDSLQIDSCNIIGWSDGGIIGLLLAIYHPDKVKKLAISGANLWADTSALTPYFFNWIHTQIDSLSQLTQTPETKNTFKLISLMRDQPNISLEQLNNIKCPTLVINGDHDVIRTQHAVQIAQAIPGANLWVLPNSGHSTAFYYSELFNKTLNEFFKEPFRLIEEENQFK